MDELQAILETYGSLAGDDRDAVLATVVHVTGSAYRRPGARLLLVPDGRRIGSISGGCLEGEISRKAWWFTASGAPVVRVYDTTSDDEAVWEFGLGCNGIVHVLLERVATPAARETLAFLEARWASRTPAVSATVIRAGEASGCQVGDRLLLDESGICGGTLAASSLAPAVRAEAGLAFREKQSRLLHVGQTELFLEWIGPPLSLVVLGAGHDVVPLVAIARQLGWTVTVADGRPAYARPERFPGADRVVLMTSADPLRNLPIDSETAIVLMTHNYPLDARLLPRLLPLQPRYLGLLGPKQRAERLLAEIGLPPPASLHAPVGLDVGCDSPAAIALSIVAEIQAALNGRAGGMLKHRRGSIHAPVVEVGEPSPAGHTASASLSYCEAAEGSYV